MDVALVSPRRIIRKGLCTLLAQKDSIRVVADVDNAIESFDLFRKTRPEVVLIDCTHPANDLETLSRLRILLPETKLLLLIETPNEDFEFHAIKAGARGCVPKEADPQASERALHVVRKGEAEFPSPVERVGSSLFKTRFLAFGSPPQDPGCAR